MTSHRKVLEAWQERHIDDVVKFFYSGSTISPEARVFGSVYEKLAQGLVDKGVLSNHALKDIAVQIPAKEWRAHLFWIARDSMPRSKRPPHYTEEQGK